MTGKFGMAAALAVAAALAAGCSNLGDSFETTSALPATPKVDPACQQLAASIDALRREGISEKVEKAAAKKYKMTAADLTKAAQLNRANDDFQSRCSTVPKGATAMTTSSTVKGAPARASASSSAPAAKASSAPAPAAPATAADAPVRTARAPGVAPAPEPISASASTAASSP